MTDLQKQITQTLAECYNLLSNANLSVQGAAIAPAGRAIDGFKAVISELNSGTLVIAEVEQDDGGDNETE